MPYENFKKALENASREKSPELRSVKIAAVISHACENIGYKPVLVGGAAVAFYTDARHTTEDIDLVAPSGKKLTELMLSLGFSKHGKDFIHKKLEIYVEFPSSELDAGENYTHN